jgi:hypothetical protein
MRARHLFSAVLLLLSCASSRAGLEWSKPVQEFQTTPDQSSVEARFAFRNTGQTPVTIKSMKTSCGCTTASLEKKQYLPGEQGEVVAVYKFPFQKGSLRKIVTVATDEAGAAPQVLDIRVMVQEPFEIKPALVVWRAGGPVEGKGVQLLAKGGHPVRVKSVSSSNPRLSARLETVKAGEEYSVLVTPTDTASKEAAVISVVTDFPADAPKTYTIHARIK